MDAETLTHPPKHALTDTYTLTHTHTHTHTPTLSLFISLRRINIGLKYQAEIPEMQDRSRAQQDPHKANLLWAPLQVSPSSRDQDERGETKVKVMTLKVTVRSGNV